MKLRITVLLLFVISTSFAQVAWQPSFKAALAAAKTSKKLVAMECYHPECPHCKVLNKNLENPTLAKFLNKNYINCRINLSKAEEVKILDNMGIRLPNYPMFLYFTADGKFVNYLDPSEELATLIKQQAAELGQSCNTCATEANQSADRNIKCAVFSNITGNVALNNRLSDSLFHKLEMENSQGTIGSWVYFGKTVLSIDNNYFKYWIENVPVAAKYQADAGGEFVGKEKDKYFSVIQKKIIQLGKEKNIEKVDIDNVKYALNKIGDPQITKMYTWELDTKYMLLNQDFDGALKLLNELSEKYPNPQTSIALFRVINEFTNTNAMNSFFEARKDATLSGLKTPKEKKEFYQEAAQFYAKDNNKKEALEAINQAKINGGTPLEIENLTKRCKL